MSVDVRPTMRSPERTATPAPGSAAEPLFTRPVMRHARAGVACWSAAAWGHCAAAITATATRAMRLVLVRWVSGWDILSRWLHQVADHDYGTTAAAVDGEICETTVAQTRWSHWVRMAGSGNRLSSCDVVSPRAARVLCGF